ncbi:MAG TPA: SCO family protein [Burkholderiaceae bacterium]|nr:SCO family protein [Burkholderiaceae bacterium]
MSVHVSVVRGFVPWAGRRAFVGGALLAGAVATLGALTAGCEPQKTAESGAAAVAFRGIDLTGAPYGKGFALTDMHGQPRTLADFKGQVVLLYFGFVQCPDVCPTALTRANEVLTQLGPERAARVQVLFVTVDPERDTPELLRHYMTAFNPRFLALRGNAEQTQATAAGFKAFYQKVPTGSSYTMDHSALSYLFDPQGRLRVALRHEQTAADYTADIAALLAGA